MAHCEQCSAELPEDAQFCIECGSPVRSATTGATQALDARSAGPRCAVCRSLNPHGALFCVRCGHAINAPHESHAPRPVMAPLPDSQPLMRVPSSPPPPPNPPPPIRMNNESIYGLIVFGFFLIGLVALGRSGLWWPGILVLIGTLAMMWSTIRGQFLLGLQAALWMFGLAIIARLNLWWPGIVLLIILSMLLTSFINSRRRVW